MKYWLVLALVLNICLGQQSGCSEGCVITNCIMDPHNNTYYCIFCQVNYFLPYPTYPYSQCATCPMGTNSNQGATTVSQCITNYNQSCSIFNSPTCSNCSQNYYLSENGQCISCPIGQYSPNANTLSSCSSCADGGCQSCYENTIYCLTCLIQYYFTQTNCTLCPVGSWTYSNNTQTQCQPCPFNYNCETCFINAAQNSPMCTTCPANSYLIPVLVTSGLLLCMPCNNAQYTPASNSMNSCIQCPDNCLSCNSSGCQQCSNGYYVNGANCAICLFPCTSCSSATICDNCIYPVFLNGTSCLLCPEGQYEALGVCQQCTVGCYSCASSEATPCYMCATNYVLVELQGQYQCVEVQCKSSSTCPQTCPTYCSSCSQNGTCVSCVSGYYLYSYLCLQCIQPCSTCSNYTVCTSCQSMNYLNNGSCFSCPTNQSSNANNTESFCCQANCSTCLNNANCQTCQQNYYMTQGQMCLACPSDLYTPAGNTYTFCSSTPIPLCPLFCSNCLGSTCLNCLAGYSLNANSCVFEQDSSNNDSSGGLPQSTVIALATLIPICIILIIGIIIYCVRNNRKQDTGENKSRISNFEISERRYNRMTDTNLV